jgi:hypothetical protein
MDVLVRRTGLLLVALSSACSSSTDAAALSAEIDGRPTEFSDVSAGASYTTEPCRLEQLDVRGTTAASESITLGFPPEVGEHDCGLLLIPSGPVGNGLGYSSHFDACRVQVTSAGTSTGSRVAGSFRATLTRRNPNEGGPEQRTIENGRFDTTLAENACESGRL